MRLAEQPERVHTKATAEEEAVRHAVMTGNYELAIECALQHGQMADAQDDLMWEMVSTPTP